MNTCLAFRSLIHEMTENAGSLYYVHSVENTEFCPHNVLTKLSWNHFFEIKLQRKLIPRITFLVRVNFLFFHTVMFRLDAIFTRGSDVGNQIASRGGQLFTIKWAFFTHFLFGAFPPSGQRLNLCYLTHLHD